MGASGSFGVILHGKGWDVQTPQTFHDIVVQSDVGDFRSAVFPVAKGRYRGFPQRHVYRETVVVGGNFDFPGASIQYGLVHTPVAINELISPVAQGAAQQLIAKTDSEIRQSRVQHLA